MKVEILNQGFNIELDNSIGNKLLEIIKDKHINSIYILTAFSSDSVINKISDFINEYTIELDIFRVVTGIDQKGTPKEALLSLLNNRLITGRIFYSSSNNIFHPKIYLLESTNVTHLIIGSSNLTQKGLFVNIESSVYLEISNDSDDYKIIEDLINYYSIIKSDTDENIYEISEDLILKLEEKKLLPNKKEIYKEIKKALLGKSSVKDLFKKRAIPSLPSFFKKKKEVKLYETKENQFDNVRFTLENRNLIWESSILTERDLNIPKGSNTNITGDINIDKGNMDSGIDFRHYYRESIFSNLDWKNSTRRNSEHLEEAYAYFKIIINEEDKGIFHLKLSHNPKTDVKSYIQKNAMTKLKWGEAKEIISKDEYLNKKMKIFKTEKENYYILEIK